jgi:hypothetical protein
MSVLVSSSPALSQHTPLSHDRDDRDDMHEFTDLQSAAVSFVKFVYPT